MNLKKWWRKMRWGSLAQGKRKHKGQRPFIVNVTFRLPGALQPFMRIPVTVYANGRREAQDKAVYLVKDQMSIGAKAKRYKRRR